MFLSQVSVRPSRPFHFHARRCGTVCVWTVSVVLGFVPIARGYDSQSDGSDGAFNPQSDVTIHLGLAANGHWHDTPGIDVNGDGMSDGVYDAEKWAVVFKYTTIDIPAGVTVTFTNHPKGAPVVWLASGDVNIAGTINLKGTNGGSTSTVANYAKGGPGGFAGGIRSGTTLGASAGMGPGGGLSNNGGGGFATVGSGGEPIGGKTYGSSALLPLIGGSGGGGFTTGGGGGGGAILIASSASITIMESGGIDADGGSGSGHGSGGGIRLMADLITGGGFLRARSGDPNSGNGWGRIRIDGGNGLTGVITPPSSYGAPGPLFQDSTTPKLRANVIHQATVPSDPLGGVMSDGVAIGVTNSPVTIQIQAENVLPGLLVEVRVARANGSSFRVSSTPLDGTFAQSSATAEVTFPLGWSEIQLRTVSP